MHKFIKWSLLGLVFAGMFLGADLLAERKMLHDSLIRLHVVGASNDADDQNMKFLVRDAVNGWLQNQMGSIETVEAARIYLESHLPELEAVANKTLEENGVTDRAWVSFQEEEFPTRHYETFSLPAGVYHSLRICIGQAQGKNWWCVIFPFLCLGETTEEFRNTAVSAGFDKELSDALCAEERYEIRFFLLDCLGMLENFCLRQ